MHASTTAANPNRTDQPDEQHPLSPSNYFSASYDNVGNMEYARQLAAIDNPMHSNVTKGAKKTPLEVQLGLTLLPVRYLPRALAKSATDSASPPFLHYIPNKLRDNIYLDGYLNKINNRLHQFESTMHETFPNGLNGISQSDIIETLDKTKEGRSLISDLGKTMREWDGSDLVNNTIQYYFKDHEKGGPGITKESRLRLKRKMSDSLFEIMFDTALGVGSFWYTRKVQSNVHQDIMSIYGEAVSFENGKPAETIVDDDISNSSNKIINQTVTNYRNKRALRYGISSMPFLKHIPSIRALQWGEATVAAWGTMWAVDIMGREPTMLENFRSFVNDKLNPLYGIGDPIKSSEIIDLYQQYAYRFAPEISFKSISVNDEDANRMWAQSEKLFGRIANLMNESYNFKHTAEIDPETNTHKINADFTLPKFIYLMGHGLINARKPEWSMAFVEIANKFPDMEAVKDAAQAMQNNVNLSEVVEKYGIDLNPTGHVNGIAKHAHTAPLAKAPKQEEATPKAATAEAKPDTSVSAKSLKSDNLNREPATTSRASA